MEAILKNWLFDPTVGKIVATLFAILLVVVVVRFAQRALGRYIQDSDRRYHMRKMVTLFGYLLALLLLTLIFSDKLSSLTVAFGVTGAGIAFALQEVIASVAGWVAMSFGRLYKIGDRVQLGGIKGDVIDIGVLRTTLMECGGWITGDLYNGRIVRVSNSFIFKEPVFNYSADFPFLWDEIVMPVSYGSDYTLARRIFEEALLEVTGDYASRSKAIWGQMTVKYRIEDLKVAPVVTLMTNDNWVEYTLRYVVDYKKRRATKDMICELVLKRIGGEEGRVKLGSANFELTSIPDLDVRLLASEQDPSRKRSK